MEAIKLRSQFPAHKHSE